jgi:hypothetical protein
MSIFTRRARERALQAPRRRHKYELVQVEHQDNGQALRITLQDTRTIPLSAYPAEAVIQRVKDLGYAVDGVRKEPVVIVQKVYMDGSDDQPGDELCVIDAETLERAGRLALCGQRAAAHELIIDAVVKSTGARL